MATPVQENLVQKNQDYASSFKGGDLKAPPSKKYAVELSTNKFVYQVTCMDARIHAPTAFGIDLGEAHIIRNAGGSARDALRSLIISQQMLGTTEVLLIKHTKCGMATFKNADAHGVVEKQLGSECAKELEGMDFMPFADLDESVKEEVEWLKASKATVGEISGWVYDVETGKGIYSMGNKYWVSTNGFQWMSGLSRMASHAGDALERRDRVNLFYKLEEHAFAKSTANHLFLIYEGKSWTFREVYDIVLKYGTWLKTRYHIAPKEIVAMDFMNRPEMLFLWLGIWSIGAYPAMVNYNLRSVGIPGPFLSHGATLNPPKTSEVDDTLSSPNFRDGKGPMERVQFNDTVASEIVSTINGVREPDSCRSGDPIYHLAALMYTSGTTGHPKAAVVSWGKITMGGGYLAGMLSLGKSDRYYTCMPLYHATAGALGFGPCLVGGYTLVLGHRFSNRTFWPEVRESRATVIQYVGETLRYLLAAPPQQDPTTGRDIDKQNHVRLAFGNGLRPDVWKKFQERFGIEGIAEFYSATEGTGALWNVSHNDYGAGAVGRNGVLNSALLGLRTAVVQVDWLTEGPFRNPQNGNFCTRVPRGQPGELLFKVDPSNLVRDYQGYFNNTKASDSKIMRSVFEKDDAFFRTGDVVRRDQEGRWWFCDRIGDTFRWKSENVSTAEVSEALGTHPAINEANVYGIELPHHEGRAGCATIMFNRGRDVDQKVLKELAVHATNRLPPYAVPLFLRVTKTIQATGNNKQQKHLLRSEGVDPAKVRGSGDHVFWLKGGTYLPFEDEDWAALRAGRVKL
ncbi:MAG: hypothetical protein Q9183_001277 [Haloplaca sp. 2 TL-2023]